MAQAASGGGSQAGRPGAKDPYLALHWYVEVEGLIVGTFTECSGLTLETEMFEYRQGGVNDFTTKLPGPAKYPNVVLKKGMSENNKLWEWYQDVIRYSLQQKPIRKTITVSLYDLKQSDQHLRQWTFLRAFPVKWIGPEFRADQGAIAVETLEFAHEGLFARHSK